MKKPITVAVYSGVSKSTTFIERLIKGLIDNQVEVQIFGIANGKSFQSQSIKYHCYSTKINKLLRLCKYTILLSLIKLKEKKRLDKIIKSNTTESKHLLRLKYYPVLYYKPDIFHLQWAKSVEDWIWVRDFGIKFIVSLRGAHINYSPITNEGLAETYKRLFPKVDGFHAVSNAIAIESLKYNSVLGKIHVIYSGLDLEQLRFQQKEVINTDCLEILSIGRSHWKKGYLHALDAMKLLKDRNIHFHYTIIGVDVDEALYHQRWQYGLEAEVTFIRKQEFDDILVHINNADVLLLSSLEEGIANVVLEAMTLGTLVVSTDCGGMSEVVIDKETGFLVPSGDIKQLANSIKEIRNLSQNDYNTITKKARLKIEENHSNGKMVSGMLELYDTVLNN